MSDNDNQPTASLFERRVTRREMLLTSGGALAGVLLLASCGGSQEEGAQKSAPPVAGSFVGEASDAATAPFVALVASGATEEEGGDEREVRAYLCDGDRINEWFWGTAVGNEIDLSSENDARLQASLAPESATGQITLSDGTTSFPFEAELASGVAGLYDVVLTEEGLLGGTAEGGGRLEGRISEEPNAEGLYPITGTVSAPEGSSVEVEVFTEEAEPAEGRWVVLADGRVKGGKKGRPTRGFTDPEPIP